MVKLAILDDLLHLVTSNETLRADCFSIVGTRAEHMIPND